MLSSAYYYFHNTKISYSAAKSISSANLNVFEYETYLGTGDNVIVGVSTGLVLSFIIAAVVWILWKLKKKSNQANSPKKGIYTVDNMCYIMHI